MAKRIDARGLGCPQPVLLAKQALQEGEFPVEVVVETVTSRENVRRVAEKAGFSVCVRQEGDLYKVIIDRA